MGGDLGMSIINWKTFTLDSEEFGVDKITEATLNYRRRKAGRNAKGIRE